MFEEAKKKLDKISDIWRNYIWNYKFCRNKINFREDQKSNYFGDILGYFSDTFRVLNRSLDSDEFIDVFENTISFLQAIYIQQDFIEEYHYIFGTLIDKGKLKADDNYTINRNIRNEIIGHPIRKIIVPKNEEEIQSCESCGQKLPGLKQQKVLLSSTLFSNSTNSKQISYLKYHRSNNYKFREEKHLRIEIKERHNSFLNTHFDIIASKLKSILSLYSMELLKIQDVKSKIPLERLINIIEQKFEYITKTDSLYKREHLLKLLQKEQDHKRYKIALKGFYTDLDIYLKESIASIDELVKEKDFYSREKSTTTQNIEVVFVDDISKLNLPKNKDEKIRKPSFTYELGKLAEPDRGNYDFFSELLKSRCEGMTEVLKEIEYLENNKQNEFEYYSSYIYLRKLLKADE